ncbi:hypothetical protein FEP80_04934 [Burkholderia multivorans]|nr:hypothetical protein [Burkholderia multivorans]
MRRAAEIDRAAGFVREAAAGRETADHLAVERRRVDADVDRAGVRRGRAVRHGYRVVLQVGTIAAVRPCADVHHAVVHEGRAGAVRVHAVAFGVGVKAEIVRLRAAARVEVVAGRIAGRDRAVVHAARAAQQPHEREVARQPAVVHEVRAVVREHGRARFDEVGAAEVDLAVLADLHGRVRAGAVHHRQMIGRQRVLVAGRDVVRVFEGLRRHRDGLAERRVVRGLRAERAALDRAHEKVVVCGERRRVVDGPPAAVEGGEGTRVGRHVERDAAERAAVRQIVAGRELDLVARMPVDRARRGAGAVRERQVGLLRRDRNQIAGRRRRGRRIADRHVERAARALDRPDARVHVLVAVHVVKYRHLVRAGRRSDEHGRIVGGDRRMRARDRIGCGDALRLAAERQQRLVRVAGYDRRAAERQLRVAGVAGGAAPRACHGDGVAARHGRRADQVVVDGRAEGAECAAAAARDACAVAAARCVGVAGRECGECGAERRDAQRRAAGGPAREAAGTISGAARLLAARGRGLRDGDPAPRCVAPYRSK